MVGILQVVRGPEAGCTYTVGKDKSLPIGRGQHAGIPLSDPKVSRLHCQVRRAGDKIMLADAGSAAGTWVNGARITEQELCPGDLITLGGTQLSFQWSDTEQKRTESWPEGNED